MRDLRTPALALLLTFTTLGVGRGADDPRAILDAAIKAHGGDRLARTQKQIRTVKGTLVLETGKVPLGAEFTMQLPDRTRATFDLEPGGRKLHMLLVLNGKQGWGVSAGVVRDLTPGELDDLREDSYDAWVETLWPLRDKAFRLMPLPETKINDRPAVGIKVAREGHGDVALFFDKQSHLLVRRARAGKSAKESVYSDFKEFDGLKLPTHVVETKDGKKTTELTITGYRFPERLDESLFAKP
jgi:hypothetical protein